jgi:hypothetical protein
VSIDLGELAGVVGDVDFGSHGASMRRFDWWCKNQDTCQSEMLARQELLLKRRVGRLIQIDPKLHCETRKLPVWGIAETPQVPRFSTA